jgi:hypothetical protein
MLNFFIHQIVSFIEILGVILINYLMGDSVEQERGDINLYFVKYESNFIQRTVL